MSIAIGSSPLSRNSRLHKNQYTLVSELPSGLTVSPEVLNIEPGGTSTITVSASEEIDPFLGQITLTAKSSSLEKSYPLNVSVVNPPSFSLVPSQTFVQLTPGGAKDIQVQIAGQDRFRGNVTVTSTNLPNGISISPPLLTLSSGSSGTFKVSAATNVPEGSFNLSLQGVSGVLSDSSQIAIGITFDNAEFRPEKMDLPIVYINTENEVPIVSKDEYVNGHIRIDPNGNTAFTSYEGDLTIKGRGNSTWAMLKKPYKIKLNSKASLLGMPADKEWVLLANYADKTLLRTYVAMELSKRFNMPYTPRSQYVELFINDVYYGTYQLIESIKIAKNRVNITEMEESDISGDAVTGGYLMEVDERLDEEYNFMTTRGIGFDFHEPDPTPEQFDYMKGYIQQTEDALYSDGFLDPVNGYANYMDTDTTVNWFLVNEVFKNNDAIFWSSVWMYKDRNKKLCMGPVWDFDIGAGNVNYNGNDNPEGWWVRDAPWVNRMFEDSALQAKVTDRWHELKTSQIDTIFDFIDQTAGNLQQAQGNNFQRWPILNEYVWPNPVVTGSYDGEVQYLKDWLTTRIAWMDAQFR